MGELSSVMAVLANTIIVAAKLLSPALVETLDKVYEIFGVTEEQKAYELNHTFCAFGGNKVTKGQPLFPRLDPKVDAEYIHSLSK